MKRYQHGKIIFSWCDTCGTLVLGVYSKKVFDTGSGAEL